MVSLNFLFMVPGTAEQKADFLEEETILINQDEVAWIPGDILVTQVVDVPDLSKEEEKDFIEMAMEASSPFPLEQLGCGFFRKSAEPKAVIFATWMERMKEKSARNLESYTHALPSFLPALYFPPEEPKVVFYKNANTLSALAWTRPNALHSDAIVSRTLSEDSDATIEGAKKELLGELSLPVTCKPDENLLSIEATPQEDGSLKLRLNDKELSVSYKELQTADLRENDFLEKKKQERKLDGFVWKSLKISAYTFAVWALLLAGQLAASGWLGFREDRLVERARKVAEIENNDTLLQRLRQFSADELKPFDMLEVINSKRPPSIYFTQMTASDATQMTLEGMAGSVNEFNEFTERLMESERFASVETPSIASSSGKVKFTMRVVFQRNGGSV